MKRTLFSTALVALALTSNLYSMSNEHKSQLAQYNNEKNALMEKYKPALDAQDAQNAAEQVKRRNIDRANRLIRNWLIAGVASGASLGILFGVTPLEKIALALNCGFLGGVVALMPGSLHSLTCYSGM